ncbi:MAG TPA: MarR family transcriptional regulator [Caulobacteraceae bacterium]|nr:MarR family transcriptional regulator [Caulobacteraceae bacterium]
MFAEALSDLIVEIFRINGRLLAAGDRLVADLGLTSARWQVIGAIAIAGQPQTVPAIARTMGLTRQAVQRLINELMADGLVEARVNPNHRRARLFSLTRAGAAAFEGATARQAPWAEALAAGGAVADFRAAEAVLRTLRGRLEAQQTVQES